MIIVSQSDPSNETTQSNTSLRHLINNQCLGVVLAGGLSSRMGVDKSSLQRNEVNMLNYSKQLLTDSGIKNIVISGNPNNASSQDNLIADVYKQAGPLGGIASIIQTCKPKALLILPVDLPLMTFKALEKIKRIGELSQQACFYEDNYLPLYLPINAHVESFMKSAFFEKQQTQTSSSSSNTKVKNGPSIRALLKQVPHQSIHNENQSTLFNANTPEEWKTATTHFSNQGVIKSTNENSLMNVSASKKNHRTSPIY